MQRRRRFAALAATAAGLVAAPAAHAATLTVDDNKAQCPTAGFTSIQAAVNAAAAGDTVAVCPGDYTEGAGGQGTNALTIAKSVTIRGAGADKVVIRASQANGFVLADGNQPEPPLFNTTGDIVNVSNGATLAFSGATVTANGAFVESAFAFVGGGSGSIANTRITNIVQPEAVPGGNGKFRANANGFGVVASDAGASGTGAVPITISGSTIDGYNKGAVILRGARTAGTITNTVIRGAGEANVTPTPPASPQPAQNGIQVDQGASLKLTGSQVLDNRYKGDPNVDANSIGVLFLGANLGSSQVTGSTIQNNVFGVEAADASGAALPANTTPALNATGNYWGNPNGPSPSVDNAPPGEAPPNGDYVSSRGVTFVPFLTTPPAFFPAAPGQQADAAPAVKITSPADGATVNPNQPVTVTATASDDFGVASVTFRRGTQIIGTDTTPPYQATFTPTSSQAGTSQSITAVATDSSGQTSADAISVRVAGPTVTPTKEDRPPRISWLSPRRNAKLIVGKVYRLRVSAKDDKKGVVVRLYAGTRRICTDRKAPFTCRFRPRRSDVGRLTLVAIATDSSKQTATALRSVRVVKPKARQRR